MCIYQNLLSIFQLLSFIVVDLLSGNIGDLRRVYFNAFY